MADIDIRTEGLILTKDCYSNDKIILETTMSIVNLAGGKQQRYI